MWSAFQGFSTLPISGPGSHQTCNGGASPGKQLTLINHPGSSACLLGYTGAA